MSESLKPNEGEPLSPIQQLGAHIGRVFADQPVDPDTTSQTVKRHINGNKDSTVTYEQNLANGNCKITLNLNPPIYQDPLNILSPKKHEGGRTVTILYQNPDANVIELDESRDAEFNKTVTAYLLTIEPMLTKRSGLLGVMELYLRNQRRRPWHGK